MSRLYEREIARKLAEREDFEPPAGLLDKIKSEIPDEITVGTEVPGLERRSPMATKQRWLIAASLVAMAGAGLVALQMREQAPMLEERAGGLHGDGWIRGIHEDCGGLGAGRRSGTPVPGPGGGTASPGRGAAGGGAREGRGQGQCLQ